MRSTRVDKIRRKLKGKKKKIKKNHVNKCFRGIGLKFFGRGKRRKH